MSVRTELREMALKLASSTAIPTIAGIVFPPYVEGGQSRNAEFMALALEGGAGGISYLLLPDERIEEVRHLDPQQFVSKRTEELAADFGCDDPLKDMIALAAINAICQHVMRVSDFTFDDATDSLGLMDLREGDVVGMVGFFPPLLKYLRKVDARLIIIEKDSRLVERFSIGIAEEGLRAALVPTLGSTLVAVAVYPALRSPDIEHLMFSFPELVFCIIGALVWIGGYTGYRLSDLARFRLFARPTGELR